MGLLAFDAIARYTRERRELIWPGVRKAARVITLWNLHALSVCLSVVALRDRAVVLSSPALHEGGTNPNFLIALRRHK